MASEDPTARGSDGGEALPRETNLDDVMKELRDLEEAVDTDEERKEVNDVKLAVERLPGGEFVERRIEKYTTRDVAESFVGSILISLPLLVEDGVFEIGDHFVANSVMGVPIWLVANVLFVSVMSWALLYWADFRQISDSHPVFGIIPRRVIGVLLISFLTSALLMTMWGRVEGWTEPVVALARISVVWTAAAFGAALGDILPGQSDGLDINDLPEELVDSVQSDE